MTDDMKRQLPADDFRRMRAYLSDDAFAWSEGPSPAPTDPMREEKWDGLLGLTTDVVLRTTDYQGTFAAELYDLSCGWIFARPLEPKDSDYMFEPGLDVGEDFEAALFVAVHGWYRQALGTLRSAIETMTIAASFAVRQDESRYREWRDGKREPKFGNGRDLLAQAALLKPAEQAIGGAGLFGRTPAGVLQVIYEELCPYVHAQANATNGAIWQSNGPVYVEEAFAEFGEAYKDTLAMCYLLLKIGWPSLQVPDNVWPLFERTSGPWKDVAVETLKRHYS
jgi:hypothetical protein